MAALAVFESLRHWLLYEHVGMGWGGDIMGQFTIRNGLVRATVSAGHSLALGYLMALAIGFWLYLQTDVVSLRSRIGVAVLLVAGLLAAYSRGPWVGAVLIYFSCVALRSRAVRRLFKAGAVSAVSGALLLASPLGDRIRKVIPFLGGKVDQYNIDYRHRLARRSWDLIREKPFFGDQEAYSKLHDLRQGVGVIDFVNTYAEVSVFYGLVGLFLFVGFILVALARCLWIARALRMVDPDLAALGVSLTACILGTLIMIYTSSFVLGYEKMYYVIAGLAAAYVGVGALRLAEHRRSIRGFTWLIDKGSPIPSRNAWLPNDAQ
jgi:O-antigen ligase